MVTPTGILAAPLAKLALTIAATEAFQAWVGAANSVEAEQSIYLISAPKGAEAPYCIIDFTDDFMRERSCLKTGVPFAGSGNLFAYFGGEVEAALNDTDAAFSFLNPMGAILEELELLSGAVLIPSAEHPQGFSYTSFDEIHLMELGRTDEDRRKKGYDAFGAAFILSVKRVS